MLTGVAVIMRLMIMPTTADAHGKSNRRLALALNLAALIPCRGISLNFSVMKEQ